MIVILQEEDSHTSDVNLRCDVEMIGLCYSTHHLSAQLKDCTCPASGPQVSEKANQSNTARVLLQSPLTRQKR